MRVSLSVVIPAYNEEANLRRCIDDIVGFLRKKDWDWEVILVNDGSWDRTGEIAKQLGKRIRRLKVVENKPNKGYGGSLKTGFALAIYDLVCFIPADNQYEFREVTKLMSKMEETGADIVSGIRQGGGRDPLHRLLIRWTWNKLVYALFGHLATDIDCGFKLFKRQILEQINLPSDGAMIDTQLFASARAKGMKIAEIPVTHLPRREGSSTGGNPAVMLKALKELLAYWWQLTGELMLEQGRALLRWELLAIALVLLVAAGLRLYRISGYMTFLGDEGRDAIVMRDIVTLRHFPLIGPGTSIGQMYLGPLYYYLTAPSLLVTNFSPVGPAMEIALIGVLTVALLWWISRQWFGRTAAIAVSLLYSISPTVITYSHSSWNPNIMPLFALLSVYGIWKVWRLGYWHWLIMVGISMAMVLNSHYLGLLLVPTLGIFWLLAKKTDAWRKYSLISLVVFLFLMSPLVWFDMRHGWNNYAALRTFFTDRQTTVNAKVYKSLPNLWPIWQDIVSSLITAKQTPLAAPLALGILGLAIYAYAKTKSKDLLFVFVWLGMGVVGLGLYKQHIYDHYYGFLFPAPFMLLGFGLEQVLNLRKYGKYFFGLVIVGLGIANLWQNPLRIPPNMQMTRTREVARFINEQAAGQPFNLALLAQRNYDRSYVYFLQQDKAPYYTIHEKLAEQLFVICELPAPEGGCEPINNPLWEIAAFGWSKIDRQWEFPWGVKVLKLVHNLPNEQK
ncbi:MAG: glycosyltransferase [bacterium]|nr:glycosyltransferase [bacterium]